MTSPKYYFHHFKPSNPKFCLAPMARSRIRIARKKEIIRVQAVSILSAMLSIAYKTEYLHEPPTTLGILTIRTELSALPDTSSVVDVLNLIVVGGNS